MAQNALTPAPETPRHRIGLKGYAWRAGCLIIWIPLILLPIIFIVLATQNEIAVWHGDSMPEGSAHPVIQVKLIMEIDTRGLNITRSYLATETDQSLCVQTDVSFLLWQGRGDNVSYCDCYAREATTQPWLFSASTAGVCQG
jgi:hypothetical protein